MVPPSAKNQGVSVVCGVPAVAVASGGGSVLFAEDLMQVPGVGEARAVGHFFKRHVRIGFQECPGPGEPGMTDVCLGGLSDGLLKEFTVLHDAEAGPAGEVGDGEWQMSFVEDELNAVPDPRVSRVGLMDEGVSPDDLVNQ